MYSSNLCSKIFNHNFDCATEKKEKNPRRNVESKRKVLKAENTPLIGFTNLAVYGRCMFSNKMNTCKQGTIYF